MEHIGDLEAIDSKSLAVGWLHPDYPFSKQSWEDDLLPFEKFREFARGTECVEALGWGVEYGTRGPCDLCPLCGDGCLEGMFGVPAGDRIFLAPSILSHYIEEHEYAPPPEFVTAVLACPDPWTPEYRAAVAPFRMHYDASPLPREFFVRAGFLKEGEPNYLRAIVADPDNDEPRLAYADWLETQGRGDRAEFIRVQCEIEAISRSGTSQYDPEQRAKESRGYEFLHEHWRQWTAELRSLGIVTNRQFRDRRCRLVNEPLAVFRRGVVEELTVTAEQFLLLGPRIARAAPTIRSLTLRNSWPILEEISDRNIAWQRITGFQDPVGLLKRLKILHAPIMGLRLSTLNLEVFGLNAEALEHLVSWCSRLHGLERLDLGVNCLGDEGARVLASSRYQLGAIRELDLCFNGIGDEGIHALADAAANLGVLTRLDLRGNEFSPAALEHLKASFGANVQIDASGVTEGG